jgi:hypothetical protein
MHHFDDELSIEDRTAREQFIDLREKQLQTVTVSAVESAVKFLFTTNAGGAVSVLAYLGAVASNPTDQLMPKISLALFFLGIIFVGIYHACLVHVYSGIFKKYQASVKRYFAERLEWEAFFNEITSQVKPSVIPYVLAYLSFGCFVLGSLLGTLGIFGCV